VNVALTDLTREEIAATLDLKPFQGTQIFHWLHVKRVFDFDSMTDLSKALRERLKAECVARQLELVRQADLSATGTIKALFRMADGQTVESVLLRDGERVTLCVSSQVGCAVRCAFCATGQGGFVRNLTAGEIVEQVLHLLAIGGVDDRNPNIVYMGMGEPFHNYDNVVKSIRLLMEPKGLNIGARRITVSTVGDVPGIRRFADEDWQVRLAVSLHAADDELRSSLVPLNRTYPVRELMSAIRDYVRKTGRMASFEYVLLRDVNDSPAHAQRLAALLGDTSAVVNLIPFNPVEDSGFAPPASRACQAFRDHLIQQGIQATIRQERGRGIDAACGQLRARDVG